MKNDYSLLRPLVLGVDYTWRDLAHANGFPLSGPVTYNTPPLRLKPLAWLDGRPVYPGDVLYHTAYPVLRLVVNKDCTRLQGAIDGGYYKWPSEKPFSYGSGDKGTFKGADEILARAKPSPYSYHRRTGGADFAEQIERARKLSREAKVKEALRAAVEIEAREKRTARYVGERRTGGRPKTFHRLVGADADWERVLAGDFNGASTVGFDPGSVKGDFSVLTVRIGNKIVYTEVLTPGEVESVQKDYDIVTAARGVK